MRQILFRIWFENPWALWTDVPGAPPHLGACWVAIFLSVVFFGYHLIRGNRDQLQDRMHWLTLIFLLIGFSLAPVTGMLPASVPVFGYGVMVLIGFTTAMWFSYARTRAVGHDPEIILDAAFWILSLGIVGGRLAYLIQYREKVFAEADTLQEFLVAAINLSEGGLVQIGGLVGGTLGFVFFCYRKKVDFFEFADIMTPAIFIGIGFGRLGCLLNGCCFGDRCDLPWAIQFPSESTTFEILVFRGFLDPNASATFPLHPTQIYSSINGFVLAFVTANYYWYRHFAGEVFAWGCVLYALTRTLLEFLRADEMGQIISAFTISQKYSLGIFICGLILMTIAFYRAHPRSSPQPAGNQ